jgi:acetyl-CoA carboxylase biotin carboxylase subunit
MEMLGSKTRARQQMEKAKVAIVPGTDRGLTSTAEALTLAESIGYPVMLKAAAGGGGKGMRHVPGARELPSAMEAAQSEARRSFGDAEVYLEKFLENPRHVEMQIFGDTHGNVVYLAERECSVQRRHQKVLEEAPCSFLDPSMRRRMGEVAVQAAKSANYCNAGTIEFLVDASGNFYFLEMNTRLQVEHPVTELVTGIDLVQLQLRVAAGEPLPFEQQDIALRGHAIELRIYAEDPEHNFFPSPGRITRLIEPSGPGIRLDSGVYEGWDVPLDYDPLLAKLVGYGEDRQQVIARLRRALDEYSIGGIQTNLPFFRRILLDPAFRAGHVDTGFLDRLLQDAPALTEPAPEAASIAAVAAVLFAQAPVAGAASVAASLTSDPRPRAWKSAALQEGVNR